MTDTERDQLETAARNYAEQINVSYFDSRPRIDIKPLIGKLTIEGMKAYMIVPLKIDGIKLLLGVCEQTKKDLLEPLRSRLGANGYQVEFGFISMIGWQRLFNRFSIAPNADVLESGHFENISASLGSIEPKFMLEPLAQLAYQLGASDIHIEPSERDARIRFRVDGALHPIVNITRDRYDLFTSDLQIRANVKWGADVPQGGRLAAEVINDEGELTPLNMRLETIPSLHGQDVVIRLFNLSIKYLSIDSLDLTPAQREKLVSATSHPRGMVLAVGPTGSGKTSTLYSIMNHLNNDSIKIVTLEDPVEYELEGVAQVPVRSEDQQLFMEKLRAVLREDPNIIMIGEIRDADTAKTSLQAALTGHLVLSTFHAASASAALVRLMDMIGQNPLLASSIKLVMAQRLVRELCPDCKEAYHASKKELLEIKTALHELPETRLPNLDNVELFRAKGCDKCHHFGFLGRLPVIEQLEMSSKIEELVSRGSTATTTQSIERTAISQGMITLLQDGVLKALAGRTTLEEVYTAVGE